MQNNLKTDATRAIYFFCMRERERERGAAVKRILAIVKKEI